MTLVAATGALAAVTLGPGLVSRAATTPITKPYVTGSVAADVGAAVVSCTATTPRNSGAPNVGGVCFSVVPAAPTATAPASVALTINDAHVATAGGFWYFEDSKGNFLDQGLICGSATLTVPDLAVHVVVLLGSTNPDNNVPPNLACGSPSPSTTGTVTGSGAVSS